MIIRRKKRRVPGLNTASVADISFTLLILFLMVTSMDEEKGLARVLPQWSSERQSAEIADRNMLRLHIDADNRLFADDKPMTLAQLRETVAQFVENPHNDSKLPEKHLVEVYGIGKRWVSDAHVIMVDADREADFNTYFQVQNEIVAAYDFLRDRLAVKLFHRHYSECEEEQRQAIRECYPQRVSEVYNMGKEGA